MHNAALTRLGGVPAVIRIDNPKTAIAWGAGPWGVVQERYATYARALRFHVDATRRRAEARDEGRPASGVGVRLVRKNGVPRHRSNRSARCTPSRRRSLNLLFSLE